MKPCIVACTLARFNASASGIRQGGMTFSRCKLNAKQRLRRAAHQHRGKGIEAGVVVWQLPHGERGADCALLLLARERSAAERHDVAVAELLRRRRIRAERGEHALLCGQHDARRRGVYTMVHVVHLIHIVRQRVAAVPEQHQRHR